MTVVWCHLFPTKITIPLFSLFLALSPFPLIFSLSSPLFVFPCLLLPISFFYDLPVSLTISFALSLIHVPLFSSRSFYFTSHFLFRFSYPPLSLSFALDLCVILTLFFPLPQSLFTLVFSLSSPLLSRSFYISFSFLFLFLSFRVSFSPLLFLSRSLCLFHYIILPLSPVL